METHLSIHSKDQHGADAGKTFGVRRRGGEPFCVLEPGELDHRSLGASVPLCLLHSGVPRYLFSCGRLGASRNGLLTAAQKRSA
jgi:hypothetical protein